MSASAAPRASICVASVCLSRCGPTCGTPACRQWRCTTSPTRSARIGRVGARNVKNTLRESWRPRTARYAASAVADIVRDREPIVPACLAAHEQITGPPVEIVELQAGDLDRAQPQPGEQHQHRVIPRAVKRRAVTAGQQRLDIGLRHRRRDRRLSPPRDPRHRLGQRPLREPADVQEPQQRPQLRDLPLRRPEAHPIALAQQEPRHDRAVEVDHAELVVGVTRAVRNRRASVSYRRTVIAANPRSAISHSRYSSISASTGDSSRAALRDHHSDLAQIASRNDATHRRVGTADTHQQPAAQRGTTRPPLTVSLADLDPSASIHRPSWPSTFSIPRTVSGVYPSSNNQTR